MAKSGKILLALLAALAILLTLMSCGKTDNKDDPATVPTSDQTQPTEPDVPAIATDVDPSDVTETTTEDITSTTGVDVTSTEATTEGTTLSGQTTTTGKITGTAINTTTTTTRTTTTTTTTARIPHTIEEIVTYYNTSANKVKTDKPGYKSRERTIIDKNKIKISSKALDAIAPGILDLVSKKWLNWTDYSTTSAGSSHNGFFVSGQSWSSKCKADWVKSATCTESGNTYNIKITLNDENLPELPKEPLNTHHGQVIKVMTWNDIQGGLQEINQIDINRWNATYSGSYVQCEVDKTTGNMKKATFHMDSQVDMEVKVVILGTHTVSLPLAQEYEFEMNY